LNSSFQQNGQTVMIFSVPGVSRTYFALVNNYFGMTCTPSGSYTDVLVCSAPVFRISTTTPKIIFYEDETYSTALHSAYFFVPVSSGLVIPTPIPWIISWAPDDGTCERGINVFCETEYRTYNGVPCMDATCSDTCGYYYSVDNCPPSGDWVAIARPPGPGWEPLDVIKK
jgi:hypothetical protein